MAKKKKDKQHGGFVRTLAWTIVLGLVFSAGLITGQRLLRDTATRPMVSLSSSRAAAKAPPPEEAAEPLRTTFSFYEHLTAGTPATAEVKPEVPAKAAAKAEDPKPAPKPEAKPEEKPEPKPEAKPEPKPEPEPAVEAREEPAPQTAPAAVEEKDATPPSDMLAKVVDSIRGGGEDADALPARYTLQVSSHPDRSSAERELDRLRKVGVEPHVVVVEVPGKGKLWRIRVGKFHSMDEARTFQGSLKEKRGVPGFVTPL